MDAAKIAFRMSRYREAKGLIDTFFATTPTASRLGSWASGWPMPVAATTPCSRSTSAMSRGCAELGVPPSDEVRRLVTQLRR